MWLTYVLFVVGFFILIKGADYLVDGASSLAKRFNVSDIAIGLTIVAFGTSAPELVVNIFASSTGSNSLALGNIFGSNIANILLILGITAVVYPLTVKSATIYKEIPFSLLSVLVLGIMANDVFFDGGAENILTRSDGFVLIGFFIIFLYYTFGIGRIDNTEGEKVKKYPAWLSIILILIGTTGLALGGKWIVDGAKAIASLFDMSEAFIGLTVVAVGTSLPELATSVVAALKKNSDIAVGNIVGSNIFNILWILGLSSIISPISFADGLNFDLWTVIVSTVLLFLFTHTFGPHRLRRSDGLIFAVLYVAYIIYLVIRG